MKKILLFTLCITFSQIAMAQKNMLEMPLPEDQTIKKGVLENGLTYYIHNTKVTKDVASYYIIQNVGSILEKDNQQGLAHFFRERQPTRISTFFRTHGL